MYHCARDLHRISTTHQSDTLRLIADYRHLTAGALAARERQEALIAGLTAGHEPACAQASWRDHFWGWFCQRMFPRDVSSAHFALNPPVVSPTSLGQPATTIGV